MTLNLPALKPILIQTEVKTCNYRILLKTNVCSKPTKTRINPRVTVLKRTEEISFYLIVILEVTPLASRGSVFEKSEREALNFASMDSVILV